MIYSLLNHRVIINPRRIFSTKTGIDKRTRGTETYSINIYMVVPGKISILFELIDKKKLNVTQNNIIISEKEFS